MAIKKHTDKSYDMELDDLRHKLIQLGGKVEQEIAHSVRGADVFLIQPTCQPVSENYMQLFIILDALRRASAGRITAVMPEVRSRS